MSEKAPAPLYGGRALPNGVLMVGPHAMAVAVRSEDGSIDTAVEAFSMPFSWARNTPFLRGLLSMAGAIVLAVKSNRLERRLISSRRGRIKQALATAGPLLAANALERTLSRIFRRSGAPKRPGSPDLARMLLPFLAFRLSSYLLPGNLLLRYHGAEHMAVNTLEAGLPLTAQSAAGQSRIHPRCGTSFAFWVILLSWLAGKTGRRGGTIGRLLTGPIIVSVAYEILRLGAAQKDASWANVVFAPAWNAQLLTTETPTSEQLEVACTALQSVVDYEAAHATDVPPSEEPLS